MYNLIIIIAFFGLAFVFAHDLRKSARKCRNMKNSKSTPEYYVLQLKYVAYFIVLMVVYIFFLRLLDKEAILVFGFLIIIVVFVGAFWVLMKARNIVVGGDELKQKFNATHVGELKHKVGLPLAKDVVVIVLYGKDNIYFKSGNNEIKLPRDKVVYIETEIGGDPVGGAIAGKAITGDSGWAALSYIASTLEYLVITYKADNKLNRIVLENYRRSNFSGKIAKDFKATYNEQPGIKAEL